MKSSIKFLYIASVDLDIHNASSTHPIEFLKGMAKNNCIVYAIFPKPKRKISYKNINFHFIYPAIYNEFGRFYFYLLSFITSIIIILFKYKDINFIYVREMIYNPFPRWLSKISKLPLIIEVNGNRLLSVNKREKRYHKIYRDQSNNFNIAKLIVTPGSCLRTHISKSYMIPDNKIIFLINGVEESNLDSPYISDDDLEYLKDKFCLGFLGTIWKCYDLYSTIMSLYLLKKEIKNIHLLFIGDGPDKSYVQKLVSKLNLHNNITITGFMNPSVLKHYLKYTNIGLMNLTKKGVMNGGPITTRFGSYAINKIPIIASDFMIDEYPDEIKNNIFLVPPENPQKLAYKILYIFKNYDEAQQKAENLYKYVVKELTWEKVTRKILSKIEDILKEEV